jgi:hypothetical protein
VLPSRRNSEQLRVILLVKIEILSTIAIMSLSLNVGIPNSRTARVWQTYLFEHVGVFLCACECVREWCVCVCFSVFVSLVCTKVVTRILHILNDFSFFFLSEDSYVGIQKLHFYFDIFFEQRLQETTTTIHELIFCGHF